MIIMVAIGSDCVTGKRQFATKDAARSVTRADNLRERTAMKAYRCQFCQCWHIGNKRSTASKSRGRR